MTNKYISFPLCDKNINFNLYNCTKIQLILIGIMYTNIYIIYDTHNIPRKFSMMSVIIA